MENEILGANLLCDIAVARESVFAIQMVSDDFRSILL
jgi:hypothetical protein